MKILVTGSKGQLGQEIAALSKDYPKLQFDLMDRAQLDITVADEVDRVVGQGDYDFCINAAAYTAVDHAETESETAFAVNKIGAGNLAKACSQAGAKLVHISTDFVFDGRQSVPYKETATPNPLGAYGKSKLEGELDVFAYHPEAIIIRTSWLYSSFGKNFVKTIAKLSFQKPELGVVYDQIGGPTYAADLAYLVMQLINKGSRDWRPGIYHYSNEGVASWYDLAVSIVEEAGADCKIKAIETWQYPTAAQRAPYTLLHKQKIKDYLNIEIPYWRDGLHRCMEQLKMKDNYD